MTVTRNELTLTRNKLTLTRNDLTHSCSELGHTCPDFTLTRHGLGQGGIESEHACPDFEHAGIGLGHTYNNFTHICTVVEDWDRLLVPTCTAMGLNAIFVVPRCRVMAQHKRTLFTWSAKLALPVECEACFARGVQSLLCPWSAKLALPVECKAIYVMIGCLISAAHHPLKTSHAQILS